MPELPEAETVRRQLETQIVGARIELAWARLPRITRPNIEEFSRVLNGATIVAAKRRGKQIYFPLDSGENFLVHLGMTGRLHVEKNTPEFTPDFYQKHVHSVLRFSNEQSLIFTDPRTFGFVGVARELPFLTQMGPEPIDEDFNEAALVAKLKTRSTKIKNAILDQKLIAGLGNIYADEVCFLAGVHPEQRASEVSSAKLKLLVSHMKPVLQRAIDARGATLKDGGYQDTFGVFGEFVPQIYGRKDEACDTCGTIIQRGVLGAGKNSRSFHFCAKCQPLRKT